MTDHPRSTDRPPYPTTEPGPDAMRDPGSSGRRQLCIGLTTVTGEQVLVPVEQAVPDDFELPPLQIPVVQGVSFRVHAVAMVDSAGPFSQTVIPDASPAGAFYLDGSMRNEPRTPPWLTDAGWPTP